MPAPLSPPCVTTMDAKLLQLDSSPKSATGSSSHDTQNTCYDHETARAHAKIRRGGWSGVCCTMDRGAPGVSVVRGARIAVQSGALAVSHGGIAAAAADAGSIRPRPAMAGCD